MSFSVTGWRFTLERTLWELNNPELDVASASGHPEYVRSLIERRVGFLRQRESVEDLLLRDLGFLK